MKRIKNLIKIILFVFIAVITVTIAINIFSNSNPGITENEAIQLCIDLFGDIDVQTGFEITYNCLDTVTLDGQKYFAINMSWFVDNNHWSTVSEFLVSADGSKIYDCIKKDGVYCLGNLIWQLALFSSQINTTIAVISQKQALNLCYEYAGYSDDIEDGYENTGYEYVYNYIGITEYEGQEYYTFVMSWLVPSGDRYRPSYIQHEFVSVTGDAVFCGVLENNSEIYFGNDYTDTQQSNFSIFFYEWQFQKNSSKFSNIINISS